MLLEQIKKRAQLQPWDIRPAPTQFHVLKELEQGASLGRQTGSEGTVLDGAVQMLQMAEKGQQCLGIIAVSRSDPTDLAEERCECLFQGGDICGDGWSNT